MNVVRIMKVAKLSIVSPGFNHEYVIMNHGDNSFTIEDLVADRDGSDRVSGIERFRFADRSYNRDDLPISDTDEDHGEEDDNRDVEGDSHLTESEDGESESHMEMQRTAGDNELKGGDGDDHLGRSSWK